MPPSFNRVLLYVRDVAATARFYEDHFGMRASMDEDGRIVELASPDAGVIMLHQAAKGQKQGQSSVKLVFDVADVAAFRAQCLAAGLDVGPIHDADGYAFANLKDPAGNSVSVSSRAFRPVSRR